jgi:hypothetical protein
MIIADIITADIITEDIITADIITADIITADIITADIITRDTADQQCAHSDLDSIRVYETNTIYINGHNEGAQTLIENLSL